MKIEKLIFFIVLPLLGFGACANKDSIKADDSAEYVIENVIEESDFVEEETMAEALAQEVPEEEVTAFARQLKNNVKAGKWEDLGWHDDENSGDCMVKIRNNNPFTIDGSDYYITYNYEYLYGEGMMDPEHHKKKGNTFSSHGTATYTHYYTDDCGPTEVRVHFNLTDRQLYDKYSGL